MKTEREGLEQTYLLKVALPLAAEGYPLPLRQILFAPDRDYRFDFCWPAIRLGVELDGGLTGRRNPQTGEWEHGKRSGHTSLTGYTRMCAKQNEAMCRDFKVLRFTPAQVASGEAWSWTERALRAAGLRSHR